MASNKKECPCYQFGEVVTLESGRKKVRPEGIKPVYKTAGAAAADCAVPETVTIKAHERIAIPLKIGFEIPNGWCIKLYPRSSLMIKRGLIQPVSIIDSDFSGNPIHAPVFNSTDEDIVLEKGERICQAMLEPVYDVIDWDHETNERDPNGFGGSGRV